MILAGSAPLASGASASSAYGLGVSLAAQSAAGAAGVGPLAGALERLGAKASMASGQIAVSLSQGAAVLEASAGAYARSDRPLAGSPLEAVSLKESAGRAAKSTRS